MRGLGITGASIAAALAVCAAAPWASEGMIQPFAFLAPPMYVDGFDPGALENGNVFVKVLPGRGRELAVVAAMRTTAPPQRLIAWMRRVDVVQKGRYVSHVGRFSSPPHPGDVAALTLGEQDFEDIRNCRPGDCGLKLSRAEIVRLQQRLDQEMTWKRDVEEEFRSAVLERARGYLADGDPGLPVHEDDSADPAVESTFAALVDHLGLKSPRLPGVAEYLERYPRIEHPDVVESFLYWSTETLGFKPITNITHLTLMQSATPGMPGALAISRQVYANHYKDGAVAVTAIAGSSAHAYLVYAHRSNVDVLDGVFGAVVRRLIERRVKEEAPAVLNALRVRLESGDPP
jgi:hypothetical protein